MDAYKEVGAYVVTCLSETDASDYKVRVLEMAPLNEVTKPTQPSDPSSSLPLYTTLR